MRPNFSRVLRHAATAALLVLVLFAFSSCDVSPVSEEGSSLRSQSSSSSSISESESSSSKDYDSLPNPPNIESPGSDVTSDSSEDAVSEGRQSESPESSSSEDRQSEGSEDSSSEDEQSEDPAESSSEEYASESAEGTSSEAEQPESSAGASESQPEESTPEAADTTEEPSEPTTAPVTNYASTMPAIRSMATGVTVYSNTKASVDASNSSEGYLLVRYTGGKNVKIKCQVIKSGGTTYTYNLSNDGATAILPLTAGGGSYEVNVYEQVSGQNYSVAFGTTVSVSLRSEFLPFLYPSQLVNYTSSTKCVQKAASLCSGVTNDLKKVDIVFHWVCDSFSYNNELAATVTSGYIPNLDSVYNSGTGICFDYAATMTAMLRTQGVPCKMVFGYTGQSYHAWISCYVENIGWIEGVIQFDGQSWTMMDPTFVSSGNYSQDILNYVTNRSNYSVKYIY